MNEAGPEPTDAQLSSMYERMLLIRRMEERLGADHAAGKLPGGVHLYIGQEAVAVAGSPAPTVATATSWPRAATPRR